LNGGLKRTARRRPRAIAGYPLPRPGTLEGSQRLDNDDLYALSPAELCEEWIKVRHALLHLGQGGDRLLCCYPWPLSVKGRVAVRPDAARGGREQPVRRRDSNPVVLCGERLVMS
jgi:hypothetical protein